LPTFDREGALFFFFLLENLQLLLELRALSLMGAGGCHRQVLAEEELAPPFFLFLKTSS
jgi:hypothetical protein